MNISSIKRLINRVRFSLIVLPYSPDSLLRQEKLSFRKLLIVLLVQSIFIGMLLIVAFSFTSVGSIIYEKSAQHSNKHVKMMNELNLRVDSLTRELDEIQRYNDKLLKVITSGDTIVAIPKSNLNKNLPTTNK